MEVRALDAADLYVKMMAVMRSKKCAVEETRNGEAYALQEPLMVRVQRPDRRVLLDPVRNCNPFFHVAEIVWMMAGESNAEWLAQFNSRMMDYADEVGTIHGAYGARWRRWWPHPESDRYSLDQIYEVVRVLREDSGSRRAVLSMWDPEQDLGYSHPDHPCNTHIIFRIINGRLNMMVCNRSNDVIWGMTGANIVHMTALQELVASELGIVMGPYWVSSMNAHVYRELPNLGKMLRTKAVHDAPGMSYPLLKKGETIREFFAECEDIVSGHEGDVACDWLKGVAVPMIDIYLKRRYDPNGIACPHWRQAAVEWLKRNRDES